MRLLTSARGGAAALFGLLAGALVCGQAVAAGADNGFDLSNSILPRAQILHGGPPKDGIPAISDPKMIAPGKADYLEPSDRVLGIELGGEARAYPIPILNWHEIVNDEIGGRRFAVTFCPLCGTGVAFDANIDGENTDFGVSGLLYNSDVLLYDRATESLWSQIIGKAISGQRAGRKLVSIPITHTTWGAWLEMHPQSLVMSDQTGHSRDYRRDPYAGYEKSRHSYFAVNNEAPDDYHPKEVVVGLEHGGVYRAYPFVELDRQGKAEFSDTLGGKRFDFRWDAQNRSLTVADEYGRPVAAIQGFWFAWVAFHPDTEVLSAP